MLCLFHSFQFFISVLFYFKENFTLRFLINLLFFFMISTKFFIIFNTKNLKNLLTAIFYNFFTYPTSVFSITTEFVIFYLCSYAGFNWIKVNISNHIGYIIF